MRTRPQRFPLARLLVIVACFAMSGCEAGLTYVAGKTLLERERASIYITENARDIDNCTLVRHVKSKSRWGGMAMQDSALERVISNLTHDASRAGANVLLIRDKSKGFMGSSAEGDAYACKEIKFASPTVTSSATQESMKPTASQSIPASLVNSQPSEDIAAKLTKLKELKEAGLLTEEEYAQKRKNLIDKLD